MLEQVDFGKTLYSLKVSVMLRSAAIIDYDNRDDGTRRECLDEGHQSIVGFKGGNEDCDIHNFSSAQTSIHLSAIRHPIPEYCNA